MHLRPTIARCSDLLATLAFLAACAGCGSASQPAASPDLPSSSDAGAARIAANASPADPPPATEVPELPLWIPHPLPLEGCDASRTMALFGECERLAPVGWQASGDGDPRLGADGDACTDWNSGGFPPADLTVDLGRELELHGVVLIPEMTPERAEVQHLVEVSADGATFQTVFRTQNVMHTRVPYALVFPTALRARSLRVSTVDSPSWVAWREVMPFACVGGARVPGGTEIGGQP